MLEIIFSNFDIVYRDVELDKLSELTLTVKSSVTAALWRQVTLVRC